MEQRSLYCKRVIVLINDKDAFRYKDSRKSSRIPIIKIRRSWDRLILWWEFLYRWEGIFILKRSQSGLLQGFCKFSTAMRLCVHMVLSHKSVARPLGIRNTRYINVLLDIGTVPTCINSCTQVFIHLHICAFDFSNPHSHKGSEDKMKQLNSLRPSDAYLRQWTKHHCFR